MVAFSSSAIVCYWNDAMLCWRYLLEFIHIANVLRVDQRPTRKPQFRIGLADKLKSMPRWEGGCVNSVAERVQPLAGKKRRHQVCASCACLLSMDVPLLLLPSVRHCQEWWSPSGEACGSQFFKLKLPVSDYYPLPRSTACSTRSHC